MKLMRYNKFHFSISLSTQYPLRLTKLITNCFKTNQLMEINKVIIGEIHYTSFIISNKKIKSKWIISFKSLAV